jgi:hypothetical protein
MVTKTANRAGKEVSKPICVLPAPKRTAKAALKAAALLKMAAQNTSTERFQAFRSSTPTGLGRKMRRGQRLIVSQVGKGCMTMRNCRGDWPRVEDFEGIIVFVFTLIVYLGYGDSEFFFKEGK